MSRSSQRFPALQYMNLANGLTSSSLALGFISCLLISEQRLGWGFACYALAILLDRLDGVAARRCGQASPFGKELDSLADAVNFCLYPPLFYWLMQDVPLWTLPFLLAYILAGIWRLCCFHLSGMQETNDQACFIGVPTTVCASWFVIVIAALLATGASPLLHSAALCLFFAAAATLMISSVPYPKNGLATKLLYVLIPLAVLFIWLYS